jgi:hypothetical protein
MNSNSLECGGKSASPRRRFGLTFPKFDLRLDCLFAILNAKRRHGLAPFPQHSK